MKRILFALSLFLALGISTNAFSQAKPDTTYNKAEVELLIEKKGAEINKDIREEMWNKVDKELEDAKADLYWWLSALSIIFMVVIGVGGIGLPILFGRDLKSKTKLALEEETDKVRKVRDNAEDARNETEKAKEESKRTKSTIERTRHDIEQDRKNTKLARDEAEKILEKMKVLCSKAEDDGAKIEAQAMLSNSIYSAEPQVSEKEEELLMNYQGKTVDEIAADETVPAEGRLRAKALKAQEEGSWEDALELWKVLRFLEPNEGDVLFYMARSLVGLRLYVEAASRYEELSNMNLGENEELIFYNWGNTLYDQALTKGGDEAYRLYEKACEKYKKATKIKPDKDEAFYNWGNALSEQAEIKEGEEAYGLYEEACDKYEKATKIRPDKEEAFSNWGTTLSLRAATKDGGEADRLFDKAYDKYEKATKIRPGLYKAFRSWGVALEIQADTKEGKEAESLLKEAEAKFLRAEAEEKASKS